MSADGPPGSHSGRLGSAPTVLDFWFDFASTYSYLSAMRIDALAAESGVHVRWRPFLLGPIFKAQGWSTSPFNVYPVKGRYMVRDIERLAAERGIAFKMPPVFPANSLTAARIAMAGDANWTAQFSRCVFAAQFGRGEDIGDALVLGPIITACGGCAATYGAATASERVKRALRAETEAAQSLGIFGAPTFITADGELFWGDDRLEQAIAWSTRHPTTI